MVTGVLLNTMKNMRIFKILQVEVIVLIAQKVIQKGIFIYQ